MKPDLYFVVATYVSSDAQGVKTLQYFNVRKAKSVRDACRDWLDYDIRNDYGGSYAPFHSDEVVGIYTDAEAATAAVAEFSKLFDHWGIRHENKT